MAKQFGDNLWKNVKAVRFGRDGGVEAPVRADGEHGIRIGTDAGATTSPARPAAAPKGRGQLRELLRRRFRRS